MFHVVMFSPSNCTMGVTLLMSHTLTEVHCIHSMWSQTTCVLYIYIHVYTPIVTDKLLVTCIHTLYAYYNLPED